jgi:ACS family hexuronate transporter-like MFS transporter
VTAVSAGSGAADVPARRRLRWAIVSLLFAATLINYIDRQTLAVLAPTLKQELHLTNFEYARINSFFLAAYALTMWLFGAVFDRLGNRRGFALAICWWSLASLAHAFVRGARSLSAARFALGAGESGNWPGATRSVAVWFPAEERAFAMGIVNTGAALGSAVAPVIVVTLQLAFGWRAAFLATGVLGFLWLAAWLLVYPTRNPRRAPHLPRSYAPSKLGGSARDMPRDTAAHHEGGRPVAWSRLFKRREVWAIVLARFFGDPIWWLYLNWLPLYLTSVRGFDLKGLRAFVWAPFVAADLGCLLGGLTSSVLVRRGVDVNRARKTAIMIGTALMPAGMVAAYVRSPYEALLWFSLTLFGFQFWVGNVQTLASDYFPVGAVGSIAGYAGTAAALGAMIFTLSTGWVVDHYSYTPILVAAGLLGPLATGVLFLLGGRIRPIDLDAPPGAGDQMAASRPPST